MPFCKSHNFFIRYQKICPGSIAPCAKGLDFPVVFITCLEDGIFPSVRLNDRGCDKIEEERRLMYVAVTRAKKRLFLTYAKSRFLYGKRIEDLQPSRFLVECGLAKPNNVDVEKNTENSYSIQRSGSHGGTVDRNIPQPTFTGTFSGEYKSSYGKNLEDKKPTQNTGDKHFEVGMTVMHKRFGKGTIIELENMGNNSYAKIDFGQNGVMMLAVAFAPITVIEE